eukprot:scaffold6769_cov114-Isochrysis_galbana.AAC.5
MPTVKGITRRDAWAHALYSGVMVQHLRNDLRIGTGREPEWLGKRRIITDAAAMHHSRRRRKAELVLLEKVVGAHAEAARLLKVVLGPGEPHVVAVLVEVHLEQLGVEVREIVVYPLLAVLFVIAKVARQEQHRVLEAQSADLRVLAGVTHRTTRRCQLSAYS